MKNKPMITKRKIVALLLTIMLLTSAFYVLTASNGGGATYLTGDSFQSDYSYLIFTNTTHYFAQNGTTGTVDIESTNASYVRQQCVDSLISSGGTLFYKIGIYDFADVPLTLYDGVGVGSVRIVGEAKPSDKGVVWRGNGTNMVKSNLSRTDPWIQSADGAFHSIHNIKFEHTTQSADDVTLNFEKLMVELDNVWVTNKNTTKQGTGIWIGNSTTDVSNTGISFSWKDVSVSLYDVGMNVSVDHLVICNTNIWACDTHYFVWLSSAWSSIYNLGLAGFAYASADAYPLYFDTVGQACFIHGLSIEGSGHTFNESLITVVNPSSILTIDGFFAQGTLGTGVKVWNRTDTSGTAEAYVHLTSRGGYWKSEYSGKHSVAHEEWMFHNVFNTPCQIHITIEDDITYLTVPVVVGAIDKNATHFQVGVYWINGTAIVADAIEIYWWASVNTG